MPEHESVRSMAEAIGRISCIKTGEEIGLLYQWDNGETQVALYDDGIPTKLTCSDHPAEPDIDAKRRERPIAAIDHVVPMLRCGPSKLPFAHCAAFY